LRCRRSCTNQRVLVPIYSAALTVDRATPSIDIAALSVFVPRLNRSMVSRTRDRPIAQIRRLRTRRPIAYTYGRGRCETRYRSSVDRRRCRLVVDVGRRWWAGRRTPCPAARWWRAAAAEAVPAHRTRRSPCYVDVERRHAIALCELSPVYIPPPMPPRAQQVYEKKYTSSFSSWKRQSVKCLWLEKTQWPKPRPIGLLSLRSPDFIISLFFLGTYVVSVVSSRK